MTDVEKHTEEGCNKCSDTNIFDRWEGIKLCKICYEDLLADARNVTEDLEEVDSS